MIILTSRALSAEPGMQQAAVYEAPGYLTELSCQSQGSQSSRCHCGFIPIRWEEQRMLFKGPRERAQAT